MQDRNVRGLMWVVAIAATILVGWSWRPQDPQSTEYRLETDVPYRPVGEDPTDVTLERCKLDLYLPLNRKGFATVIWFHGGGLTQGNKSIPSALQEQGIAVVAPNYRLSPKVSSPTYIEDAAAAVAWTLKNIEGFQGDAKNVFVSGHSAGGYLASMVALDARWLKAHDCDPNQLAGIIPFSGQSITHFTIRAERGISDKQPIIDELAPLYHVRKDAPPILLISGDREQELLGRYEETAYFWRMLREIGHPDVALIELPGFNHSDMAEPAFPHLLKFVRSHQPTPQ